MNTWFCRIHVEAVPTPDKDPRCFIFDCDTLVEAVDRARVLVSVLDRAVKKNRNGR